ncbi:unnamed protein product [Rotaria magnacalcarata]|uniref:Uncharacterized protein n=1 Tax=Rotaria magnacalcarata TaxID=392030 RepID=A0A820E745_9BILA|nr:unnamed protein product [Rotaria magnacalcarata]CAF4223630.1 unnamed protein product [Rotaria magnacalcarata]CAF4244000.1 unnamed protein product [Rotaria magnacalcarata]
MKSKDLRNVVLLKYENGDRPSKIFQDFAGAISLHGVYNVQNDRIWAANRQEADAKDGITKKRKYPTKVMVWLGTCRNGLTKSGILDNGTVNHEKYIEQVLPVALKCAYEMTGSDWTYQHDGATEYTHHLS